MVGASAGERDKDWLSLHTCLLQNAPRHTQASQGRHRQAQASKAKRDAGAQTTQTAEQAVRTHLEAAPQDALHRRHARVGPAVDAPRLDEPRQLALGEHRVDEVEAVAF